MEYKQQVHAERHKNVKKGVNTYMKKYTIVNMVEIDGKDVRLDTLTPEQRKQLAIKWQDRIMQPAGFKRKTA